MSTIFTAAQIEDWADTILAQIQETADKNHIKVAESATAKKAIEYVRASMAFFDTPEGPIYREHAEQYALDFETEASSAAAKLAAVITAAMAR